MAAITTTLVWIIWVALLVFSVLYVVLAAKAFEMLGDIQDILEYEQDSDEKSQLEENLRGSRATCILSIMAVIAYAAYSFYVSFKTTYGGSTLNGLMNGILWTSSLYSSAFMLLAGVVLQSNDLLVDQARGDGTLRRYRFTFAMAYAMTGIYVSLLVYHIVRGFAIMNDRTASTNVELAGKGPGPL